MKSMLGIGLLSLSMTALAATSLAAEGSTYALGVQLNTPTSLNFSYLVTNNVEVGVGAGATYENFGSNGHVTTITGRVGGTFLSSLNDHFNMRWLGLFPGVAYSKSTHTGSLSVGEISLTAFTVHIPMLGIGAIWQAFQLNVGPAIDFTREDSATTGTFNLITAEVRYAF